MLYLVEQCASDPGYDTSIDNPAHAAHISRMLIQLGINRLYVAPQRAALETVAGFLRCAETAERGFPIVVDYSLGTRAAWLRPLSSFAEFGITRAQQIHGRIPTSGAYARQLQLWEWWQSTAREIMDSPVPTAIVADAATVLVLQRAVSPITPARALVADAGRVAEYVPHMLGWKYSRTI